MRPAAAAAAVMIVPSLPVEAGELRITIDGIRSTQGVVLIGLH